ncbi:MAG TPA: CcmD family protein [Chitinophagales bacterium]|nr:CcmD family protein [Chitinophagales bacterium]HMW12774.1 CcmD family protein [Chitinophagales bacterium]HMX60390.1 CcmD family protein [Chitinophagales bacterium]HMY24631.1 CcmD family protein [Chitinophagales bacterium]HMZ34101.1 CcmD family protein [Chitinophagales bacterium]
MSKKNAILILLFVSVSKMLNAQTANVADQLVENSKLNAVIVVAAIILLGIFIFLFSLEKKIKKLEQDVKN